MSQRSQPPKEHPCVSASLVPGLHNWVEVDLRAIRGNVCHLREVVGEDVELIAVVKASAYGHGAVPVSRAALDAGAGKLAVYTAAEAAELRRAGIEAPIYIMSPATREAAAAAAELDLEITVCEPRHALALAELAQARQTQLKAHLKVDTGMCRCGVRLDEALDCLREVVGAPGLRLVGVCSHLAESEVSDLTFTREQLTRFQSFLEEAGQLIGPEVQRHIANSAAVLRLPESRLDACRVGLAMYGLSEGDYQHDGALRPALSWKARLVQVRRAKRGETVSYGRTHTVREDTLVGLVPVGYADGYPRALSNRGEVLVRGHRAPVLGVVCMDSFVVDVGHVPGVEVGDEVVLIGEQGDQRLPASELAEGAGTIVYDIVAGLGARPERIYLNAG